MSFFSQDLAWWITAFDLPALAGLFWMNWKGRRESSDEIVRLRDLTDTRHDQLREALSAFKLEVAKTYASQGDMKDLETRLTAHLLRIESKLDVTALKAESLRGGA